METVEVTVQQLALVLGGFALSNQALRLVLDWVKEQKFPRQKSAEASSSAHAEILAEIKAVRAEQDEIKTDVKTIEKVLNGNGNPDGGLVAKVAKMQVLLERKRR